MKRLILVLLLFSILIFSIACDGSKVEESPEILEAENAKELGVISVSYDESDKEEIFGDLNQEEINKITEKIVDEVARDDDYKSNKDSIIERAFKESGIKDPKIINAAKSKIIIWK